MAGEIYTQEQIKEILAKRDAKLSEQTESTSPVDDASPAPTSGKLSQEQIEAMLAGAEPTEIGRAHV